MYVQGVQKLTNVTEICPPDAICTYGMHGGLTLFALFVFFLGTLAGWAMCHYYLTTEARKKKNE